MEQQKNGPKLLGFFCCVPKKWVKMTGRRREEKVRLYQDEGAPNWSFRTPPPPPTHPHSKPAQTPQR